MKKSRLCWLYLTPTYIPTCNDVVCAMSVPAEMYHRSPVVRHASANTHHWITRTFSTHRWDTLRIKRTPHHDHHTKRRGHLEDNRNDADVRRHELYNVRVYLSNYSSLRLFRMAFMMSGGTNLCRQSPTKTTVELMERSNTLTESKTVSITVSVST